MSYCVVAVQAPAGATEAVGAWLPDGSLPVPG